MPAWLWPTANVLAIKWQNDSKNGIRSLENNWLSLNKIEHMSQLDEEHQFVTNRFHHSKLPPRPPKNVFSYWSLSIGFVCSWETEQSSQEQEWGENRNTNIHRLLRGKKAWKVVQEKGRCTKGKVLMRMRMNAEPEGDNEAIPPPTPFYGGITNKNLRYFGKFKNCRLCVGVERLPMGPVYRKGWWGDWDSQVDATNWP